ncbi:uncharacterized protein [Haliotis cracherodii]|uniref:uncharacterized protein n=1 Tax=Haliotis cracherodii TaxID=6455 RepID=UPI0039E7A2FD
MNIIFPPEQSLSKVNITLTTPVQVDTKTMDVAQLLHYLLTGSVLLLPAAYHAAEQRRSAQAFHCNYFLMSVTFGSLLSFVFSVTAMVVVVTSGYGVNVCPCYVKSDTLVLVCMVASVALYNMTSGYAKTLTVPEIVFSGYWRAVVLWAFFAIGVQMLLQSPHEAGVTCVSQSVVSLPYDSHIYMPMFSGRQDSTTLVVLNALLYVPPSLVILGCGIRHPRSDPHTSEALLSGQNACALCQSTLRILHNPTWRYFFVFILCILRPIWLLNNWFRHHDYTDVAPAVLIMLLFYPINLVHAINYFNVRNYSWATSAQIYHV